MAPIRLELLGHFSLCYNNEPVTELQPGRLQSLLVYLALHRHQSHTRQQLAFHFWPDSSEAQALTNLRKQLLYLRRTLPALDHLLHIDAKVVRWHTTTRFEVDVEQFEAALMAAAAAEGKAAMDALQQAIAVYQGDLLPGTYDEWLTTKREELREKYLLALEKLLLLHEEQRDYAAAIGAAQELLRHDPLHETTYRRLMRLYALQDDRAAALHVYQTCVTRLQDELQVEPGIDLQHAYERLLQHQIPLVLRTPTPSTLERPPFVGRKAEWRLMQTILREVAHSPAHLLVIAGEAGIGKTRMAEELLDWAQRQGIVTARAHAYAAEGQLAYAPVIEWLRTPALRARLSQLDDHWLLDVARLLPELIGERHAPPQPAHAASWQRHRLFEALARAILVSQQPLLLVLDDLQWCDQETLAWLHFFLRYAPDARVLLVATVRHGEVGLQHPLVVLLLALRNTPQLTEVELMALNSEETAQLAQAMSGRTLDAALAQRLYRETEGHPLYIVEMVRAHQQDLASMTHPTRPSALYSLIYDGLDLPPRIHAVIDMRLAQLSPVARKVADLAAVVGRVFSFAVLSHALDGADDELVQGLDELWQRQIIRERGSDGYDFSHDKLREAVYAKLTAARRRILHRRIALALESLYAATRDEVSSHIAVHFDRGNLPEKAIPAYAKAGHAALRVHAHGEARDLLQRGLALLNDMPRDSQWVRQELDFLLTLGPVLVTLHGYGFAKVREVYLRAQEIAPALDKPSNAAILRALAIFYLTRRDLASSEQQGEKLYALAAATAGQDSIDYSVEAHYVLGVNAFWRGKFAESKDHFEQALAHYDVQRHVEHTALFSQDPGVVCRMRLGFSLWYLGEPDQAHWHCTEALALARTLAHPVSLAYALTFATWLYSDSRNDVAALALADEAVTYCEKYEMLYWLPICQVLQGYQWALAGKLDEGIRRLQTGLHFYQRTGQDINRPHALALLAQLYARKGELARGIASLNEAFDSIEVHRDFWIAAELHRLNGELLQQQGAADAVVEAHYQQALAVAQAQRSRSLELRAAISLAELWHQQGKDSKAGTLLAQVYGSFTEGFKTADLQAAQALLVKLA